MRKTYLIIGGNTGIGAATAKRLTESGDTIHTLNRHNSIDVCDFGTPLPEILDPLDGLVYFPGTITLKPFKQLTLEDFRRDWEINCLGAMRVIQNYLPGLAKTHRASIVLMSSVAVTRGIPYHASIASAKGAIEGLGRSLAAELAPEIRVNIVSPSLTDTPLAENLLDSETKRDHAAKRHPLHALGNPEDHASLISYLLSEEARWITGQTFHVDGGFSTLSML